MKKEACLHPSPKQFPACCPRVSRGGKRQLSRKRQRILGHRCFLWKTHAGEQDKHVKPQSPHFKVVGFRQRAGAKFLFESAHYSRSYDLVMMPHNLEMRGWGSKTYHCKSRVCVFSKHRAMLSISCPCNMLTESTRKQALLGSRIG